MKRPKTLSAAFVRTISRPGRYGDGRGGHGLSLLVKPMANGRTSRTWSQRIIIAGKPVNIGLGAFPSVGLADARVKAEDNARAVAQGRDPRAGGIPTFATAVEIVVKLHEPNWKQGSKTASIWRASIRDHAIPALGNRRVDRITVQHVLEALLPLYETRPETARKVRRRVSAVMKWAVAQGYRQDDPAGPAISAALPRRAAKTTHLRALPYQQVAEALATVDGTKAWPVTKACIRLIALTAVRSSEARGATWDEIDMKARVWRISAERTKTGTEHRVPLSDAAWAVVQQVRRYGDGSNLVFPSQRGRLLSDNALSKLFRENGIPSTIHGLRSSFRDWCAETGKPRELAEAALAHVVGGVEGAYFRSDLFERRRNLMDTWAQFITGEAGKAVQLSSQRKSA